MNLYSFNPELGSNILGHEENDPNQLGNQDPVPYQYCNDLPDHVPNQLLPLNNDDLPDHVPNQLLPLNNDDPIEVPEIPDTCFNYITNLLREEDSDDRPSATLHDYMDAQLSYNKSLDAALLGETCTFLANQCPQPVTQNSPLNCFDDYSNNLVGSSSSSSINFGLTHLPLASSGLLESHVAGVGLDSHQDWQGFASISNANWGSGLVTNTLTNRKSNEPSYLANVQALDMSMFSNAQMDPVLGNGISHVGIMTSNCPYGSGEDINGIMNSRVPIDMNVGISQEFVQCLDLVDEPRGRRRGVEADEREIHDETGRSYKHLAPSNEVFEQIEEYGDVLLCPEGRSKPAVLCSSMKTSNSQNSEAHASQKDRITSSKGSKKRGNIQQFVDLKSLLTKCAQCVAKVDLASAYDMLKQIREHSSPYGDCLQRVAHYLANGLEARLEGKGWELTRANEQVSPCEILKANRIFVASVPFKIMSYYTTNKTIAKLVEEAPSIHIIDFGIFYGLQWPCIIQNLSKRPNGPPKIRITGIDFPQHGFRPAERLEETGRCLAKYCERYNVPFEYHAIAKKWETIQLEDLEIERNEPLAVNCLYRSHNLYDESVEVHSPRDAFLSLVRRINPDIFMHGVVNSTSSVPFFLNRFKEAMFHYTALFDMFEATMRREDNERLLLESKLYGNQALNVIACEGIERVERPESYKQWQVRTQRAGFVQVPLDRELFKRARAMVRRNFRQEFSYDEDGHWVVQGWKGRILYAISCWKPQEV